MKAKLVSGILYGFWVLLTNPSYASASGPWGVIAEWRDEQPGPNPSPFASYYPQIFPINYDIQFRW